MTTVQRERAIGATEEKRWGALNANMRFLHLERQCWPSLLLLLLSSLVAYTLVNASLHEKRTQRTFLQTDSLRSVPASATLNSSTLLAFCLSQTFPLNAAPFLPVYGPFRSISKASSTAVAGIWGDPTSMRALRTAFTTMGASGRTLAGQPSASTAFCRTFCRRTLYRAAVQLLAPSRFVGANGFEPEANGAGVEEGDEAEGREVGVSRLRKLARIELRARFFAVRSGVTLDIRSDRVRNQVAVCIFDFTFLFPSVHRPRSETRDALPDVPSPSSASDDRIRDNKGNSDFAPARWILALRPPFRRQRAPLEPVQHRTQSEGEKITSESRWERKITRIEAKLQPIRYEG